MEADPTRPGESRPPIDARAERMRHRFRNQIQTMTSLVGLFGRRLPPGGCRSAFEDMRARFEAVAFDPFSDADPADDGVGQVDLAHVARQIFALLDPNFVHRVSYRGGVVRTSPRRAAALAQILAELLIDLVRNGFGEKPGAAELVIDGEADGAVRLRLTQAGPAPTRPVEADGADLGLQIARSVARNLGGTLSREATGGVHTEVFVPGEAQYR